VRFCITQVYKVADIIDLMKKSSVAVSIGLGWPFFIFIYDKIHEAFQIVYEIFGQGYDLFILIIFMFFLIGLIKIID